MDKLKIPYTIVVEGKYDRLKLINICDARIITTEGFGIFKKKKADIKLTLVKNILKIGIRLKKFLPNAQLPTNSVIC